MNTGPTKHNVVAPEVVRAIEAFFGARDWEGSLWLTGGTCLAEYYFGHRVSVDIDLSTAEESVFVEARAVLREADTFGEAAQVETVRTTTHFCQCLVYGPGPAPIKVDLTKDIPIVLADKVRLVLRPVSSFPK